LLTLIVVVVVVLAVPLSFVIAARGADQIYMAVQHMLIGAEDNYVNLNVLQHARMSTFVLSAAVAIGTLLPAWVTLVASVVWRIVSSLIS